METSCDLENEAPYLTSLKLRESDESVLKLIEILEQDVNTALPQLNTALPFAVCRPTTIVAEKLIHLGADINYADKSGWTPLHYAIDVWNLEAVCMLLYYNVDVSICCDNMCPLYRAIYYKRQNIVEAMISHCLDEPAHADAVLFLTTIKCDFAFNLEFKKYVDFPDNYRWGDICCYLITTPGTASMFKVLCPLIDDYNLTYVGDFLSRYTAQCSYDPEQFIDCLLAVLDSPVANVLVEVHNRDIIDFPNQRHFISNLIHYFVTFKIGLDTRLSVLYTCVSLGFEISLEVFVEVYYEFGYNAELEALIYTGKIYCPASIQYILSIPVHILFYERTLLDSKLHTFLGTIEMDVDVSGILQYYSVTPLVRSVLLDKLLESGNQDFVKQLHNEGAIFPTLVQLCRDAIRRNLILTHNYKVAYQYLEAIKALPLPQTLRDILLFKKSLY